MEKITVKILSDSSNPLPAYATSGSAGMDVRAKLSEKLVMEPMQRVAVPTGLYIELPNGFEAQIRPRSGLALKYGITCLNSPGTIDADYRGEIKIILINLSNERQVINNGDRIAQMIIQTTVAVEWEPSFKINDTERGAGGFGHSGKS